MNTKTKSLYAAFALLALGCFALCPMAQAVSPPPDGAYPGGNTAEGTGALRDLTTGEANTAVGNFSLTLNTEGNSNTGVGSSALRNNTSGTENTALGAGALNRNQDGFDNTAVGVQALFSNTTGDENIGVGVGAGFNVTTASNVICIGSDGANVDNTTWIDNIFNTRTQSAITAPVVVSNTGQLGTVASSERFKKDIATMNQASEAILSLRPVTFHYKTDTKGTPQFGLIAEEVAKVNPALVLPDKEGKPYTVRYDQVNAMLLNEFLKEHRKVEELEANAARQQKQIEALTAVVQKVSAQVEMNRPAPQTVINNQ